MLKTTRKGADHDMPRTSGLLAHGPPTERPTENPANPADYLELYGLSRAPFGAPSRPGNYILFASLRRTFELLVDHLVNGKGLVVLYGESGAGKTEMLRAAGNVAAESGLHTIRVDRPAQTRLDLEQFVSALLSQTDPDAEDPIETMLRPPHKGLLIDDLDLLPPSCLRLLAKLAQPSSDSGSVAIVAASAADSSENIDRTELIELARMARTSVRLPAIEPAEARQYIEQSLWIAGGTTRRLITPDALKLLVARAGGLPGSINRQMEAALTAGFARGDTRITAKTIGTLAAPASQRLSPPPPRRIGLPAWLVPGLAAGLLAGGIAAFLYKALLNQPEPSPAVATNAPVQPPPPVAASPPPPAPVSQPQPELPPPPAAAAKPAETLPPDVMDAVMKRGQQSLSLSDIAAARLLFQHAAEAGNPRAAVAMGKTYDPAFLTLGAAQGEKPDPGRAAEWYRKAITLGDPQAAGLLKRLEGRSTESAAPPKAP
jgi:type II secretory pathway predicted ATPase ExeA